MIIDLVLSIFVFRYSNQRRSNKNARFNRRVKILLTGNIKGHTSERNALSVRFVARFADVYTRLLEHQ